MTTQELVEIIRKADLDDNGSLDFEEFKAMLEGVTKPEPAAAPGAG